MNRIRLCKDFFTFPKPYHQEVNRKTGQISGPPGSGGFIHFECHEKKASGYIPEAFGLTHTMQVHYLSDATSSFTNWETAAIRAWFNA